MPILPSLAVYNVPGVYVNETTGGAIPAIIATHDNLYWLGSSPLGTAPIAKPTYVSNYDDFFNVFGASPSGAAIKLFFQQRSGYGIYFVNTLLRVERSVTIATFTAGTVISLTIDGYLISYTAITGDTALTARAALATLVNTQLPNTASLYPDGTLRYASGLVVTSSAAVTLGTASTLSTPKVNDVIDTITVAFDEDMPKGFLMAPEFFQSFTTQTDRTALATAMEAHCSDPNYYWVALIDCGAANAVLTTGGTAVNAVLAERALLASPRGHSWFFFPYVRDTTNTLIPASVVAAGVILRRIRSEGYTQPAAGAGYPVYGVNSVSFNVTKQLQAQLNPRGINCIRALPGKGVLLYGARTLSTSSFYRFGNIRVVLNVIAASLNSAYDQLVFSLVDGQGVYFSRVKQTGAAICEVVRQAGGLFGATSADAYLVICDLTNNNPDKLESGQITVDIYVKPSPISEVIVVNLTRVSLGATLAEILVSGDSTTIVQPPV
jgi:uncharacterized protein